MRKEKPEDPAARAHIDEMNEKYGEEIHASVEGSRIYGPDMPEHTEGKHPLIISTSLDSVRALRFAKGKTAVLNFADYVRRGGGYLHGMHAQEEALCAASDLWNILNDPSLDDYFAWNQKNQNRYLYYDRAIYTPDVIFHTDSGIVKADVISCAAPWKSRASRYHHVPAEEAEAAMHQRIAFIRNVLETEQVETCILGAFGCGVFGNAVGFTAAQFMDLFKNTSISRVVYALPQASKKKIFDSARI